MHSGAAQDAAGDAAELAGADHAGCLAAHVEVALIIKREIGLTHV
jgi:hypothetical protein